MATDYDAPRKSDEDTESLEAIKDRGTEKVAGPSDVDETDLSLDGSHSDLTPGFINPDKLAEDLEVLLLPPQDDEFTCSQCFIVRRKSLLSRHDKSGDVCIECDS